MERESSLDERLRKDQEIAEANKARQIRQGVISSDVQVQEEAPKPKKTAAKKSTAKKSTTKKPAAKKPAAKSK